MACASDKHLLRSVTKRGFASDRNVALVSGEMSSNGLADLSNNEW